MRHRPLIGGVIFAAIIGLFGGTAFAHNANVTSNCNGLVVTVTQYNPQAPNKVRYTFDGGTVHTLAFAAQATFLIGNPDKTVAHNWDVTVDQGDGNQFDFHFAGSIAQCQEATTTTAATTTTTVPIDESSTTAPPTTVLEDSTTIVTDPTTTTVPDFLPSTTIATFVCDGVLVADVCTPPTSAVIVSDTHLPRTGPSSTLWIAAAIVLAAGTVSVLVARRK